MPFGDNSHIYIIKEITKKRKHKNENCIYMNKNDSGFYMSTNNLQLVIIKKVLIT